MNGKSNRVQLPIYITAEQRQQLRIRAAQHGISMSAYIGRLITRDLATTQETK